MNPSPAILAGEELRYSGKPGPRTLPPWGRQHAVTKDRLEATRYHRDMNHHWEDAAARPGFSDEEGGRPRAASSTPVLFTMRSAPLRERFYDAARGADSTHLPSDLSEAAKEEEFPARKHVG